MKKILVPIDFSDVTSDQIKLASEQARLANGEIYLVHIETPEPDFMGYEPGPEVVRESVAKHMKDNHKKLQEVEENLKKEGLKVHAFLLQGPTVEKILDEESRINADMMVIGTHGRSKLHHLLMGSVSEGVLKSVTCPVLLVHSRLSSKS